MQYRRLGKTDLKVSILGYGGSPLGGSFGPIDEDEGVRTVHEALDSGINLFDVSPFYGQTRAETVLGRALHGIPRDRFILATKTGRYGQAEFDFSAARTLQSVEESLQRLGVETIDLFHCHDIEFGSLDQVIQETLPTLYKLKSQGKIRYVGITGLPLSIYPYVIERAEVDVILSYCHYTLVDRSLADLLPDLTSREIGVINASPLGMGLLTEAGPPEWHPAPAQLKTACTEAALLCREAGYDVADLALRFSLSESRIASTLVGMATREQLRRNLASVNAPPDPEILNRVEALLAPVKNMTWPSGRPENSDPT